MTINPKIVTMISQQRQRRLIKSRLQLSTSLGLQFILIFLISIINQTNCFSIVKVSTSVTRKPTTTTTTFPIHYRTPCTRVYNENTKSNVDENDATTPTTSKPEILVYDPDNDALLISNLCQGTNEFMKSTIIEPVRNFVEIQPAGTAGSGILEKLTAPPEVPGIPRPVSSVVLVSYWTIGLRFRFALYAFVAS